MVTDLCLKSNKGNSNATYDRRELYHTLPVSPIIFNNVHSALFEYERARSQVARIGHKKCILMMTVLPYLPFTWTGSRATLLIPNNTVLKSHKNP